MCPENSSQAPSNGSWPHIGIVIPVFGHSRLVAEAIASALEQDYPGTISIVVVIDGDGEEETRHTVRGFAPRANRSLAAIYRPNGRLPAARNTGIRYLLGCMPDLFAVYLLDADNRLSRHTITAFTEALIGEPEAGWAYPDVTFFGLSWGQSGFDIRETAPRYSRLRHRMGNICEAGSLIRASLFREGLFFDEAFTHGYEDWEFWLQCLHKGHYGVRTDNPGFLYRRRADSMLADADRISGDIRDAIRAKHGTLYEEESLWRLFAEEFRPLLFAAPTGDMALLSTTHHCDRLDVEGLTRLVVRAMSNYHHTYLPRLLIYALDGQTPLPDIDAGLLKQIMRLREQCGPRFLEADGTLSSERSDRAVHGLIPFNDLLFGRECPAPVVGLPAFEIVRRAISSTRTRPVLGHLARRYSGPPSYRIDRFVEEETGAGRRRCLIVHGAGMTHQSVAELVDGAYEVCMASLDDPAKKAPAFLHQTIYNGARVYYRPDDAAYRALGQRAAGYEAVYVADDLTYLFHIGQWKGMVKSIYFVVTGRLSADQRIALQAMEHSLTKIVCPEHERNQLAALGIPARKLQTSDQHRLALPVLDGSQVRQARQDSAQPS